MASGTSVVIPSNGANIIQTAPGLPSVALQASGAIPYPQYGVQQFGIPTNAPQQVPQKNPLEKFLNAEPKVLGAIQIMIGLIHIGFGAVSLCLLPSYYLNVSGIGGYPFWGGIFFISSGSLCVAATYHPNRGLVTSSAGMNITSAIMALTGSILNLCDLSLSHDPYNYEYPGLFLSQPAFSSKETVEAGGKLDSFNNRMILLTAMICLTTVAEKSIGYGLSSLLLLFSLLEFCIAVSLAHFGCQATCCSNTQPTVLFVPYQVPRSGEVATEPNPPPPPSNYDGMVTKSQ